MLIIYDGSIITNAYKDELRKQSYNYFQWEKSLVYIYFTTRKYHGTQPFHHGSRNMEHVKQLQR